MVCFSSSVILFSNTHTVGQPGYYHAIGVKKSFLAPACIWTVLLVVKLNLKHTIIQKQNRDEHLQQQCLCNNNNSGYIILIVQL